MSPRCYPTNTWRQSLDMKKGPNLRWSLIQCSGGDEGDRTPDLLTASQALSQLSYAPVRRSTIRELPRRCKENFEKHSPPRRGGADRHSLNGHPAGAGPIIGANRAPARPAISKLCRFTGPGREPTSMPQLVKSKPQVDDLRIRWNAGYGRPVRVRPRNPA